MKVNEFGQPIGELVDTTLPRPVPGEAALTGAYCRLERLNPDRHGPQLYDADRADARGVSWTYLPYGPFPDFSHYQDWLSTVSRSTDPLFYVIIDRDPVSPTCDRAVGVLSYLRITPEHGSIEVGHVHYSPALQRRRAATEAQYLLMRYALTDLAYRRYEWKCDALNAASQTAAKRLGFCYEGTFSNHKAVKGRNRDTAWYSITDQRWPAVQEALQAWLHTSNFDGDGNQRRPLRIPECSTC